MIATGFNSCGGGASSALAWIRVTGTPGQPAICRRSGDVVSVSLFSSAGIAYLPVYFEGKYTVDGITSDNAWYQVDEANTVVSKITFASGNIVPLDEASVNEFVTMVRALQDGTITVDSLNWQVGDSIKIPVDGTDNILMILDKASDCPAYKTFADGSPIHYIVGFILPTSTNERHEVKADTNARQYSYFSSYAYEDLKTFSSKLPNSVGAIFKTFTIGNMFVYRYSSNGYFSEGDPITGDVQFTLPSVYELIGKAGYGTDATNDKTSGNWLHQFEYFKNNFYVFDKEHPILTRTIAYDSLSVNATSVGRGDCLCYIQSDRSDNFDNSGYIGYSVFPFGCI